jgi:tetratricopeptide (TPR) repeat protein
MKIDDTTIMRQIGMDSISDDVNTDGDKMCIDIDLSICGIPSSISPTSVVTHVDEFSVPIRGRRSPTATIVTINEFTAAERLKPPRSTLRTPHHRRIASCPLQESFSRPSSNKSGTDKKEEILKRYQQEKDILLIKSLMEGKGQEDRAKLYNQLGTLYYNLGEYKPAYEYYIQAADCYCTDSKLKAITFQNIGTTQWKLGQLHGAVISFRTALQTRLMQQQQEHVKQKKRPDNFSLDMAQSYQNLGLALLLIQNVNEAMVAFETAYGIYINIRQVVQHSIHATSLDIARRLSFMGTALSQQAGKSSLSEFVLLDLALKYHHCALQIRRDGSNTDHPASSGAIRESLVKLAETYQNISNYERSLCIYQEVLSLLVQEQLKKDNDSINIERGRILHRIGSIYEKVGDVTNATKYFHDAAFAFAESGLPCLPE